MYGSFPTTTNPMVEARDRLNVVSFLEDVRGWAQPDRQMLFDVLSGIQAHERGIGKLYWAYTQQTGSQELREKWQLFGKETELHRQVAERTINALGGDPSYMSSLARDEERSLDCLTHVESQGLAGDYIRLGNLVMAENVSKQIWHGMHRFALQIKDPSTAKTLWDASKIVHPTKEGHVIWNTTMYASCFEKLTLGM